MSKHIETKSGEVSDEDSVSITSTVPSEPREEYPVEAIIAEREADGSTEYLVRWEGYPDERCTWEPESSFQSEDTLFDWKTQKMRVSRGLAAPCDIGALLDRVEKWITASENRKARRRSKRMRLGISVAQMETDVDDESHNDTRQPKAAKEVQTGLSQAPLNKGTSSKKDTIPARSRGGSEHTDGRLNQLQERPQVFTGQEENTSMNVPGHAPTAVMFHPQRQEDQGSNHSTSTAQTPLESPIKSSGGIFRKSTDATKELPPIRDSHLELHPQRQEVQSSNHLKSTAKDSPVSPTKSSVGTVRKTTDSVKKLPTARDSLPEKESSIPNLKSSLPSTLPPKINSSNLNGRGSASNSRSGMVGPNSPTKETHSPRQVQMGRSGRGPARLAISNLKPSPTSPKRPSVTGAALLKNWNKNVKPRRSMAYQGSLPNANERAPEKFGKLSVKRKYEKAGRNEPAPDFDKLIFMELKPPAKKPAAKKPSLSLPGLKIPSKTPFEMIQEGLNESNMDDPLLVETPVSSTSEAITAQPAKGPDDQGAASTEINTPSRAYNPSQVNTVLEPAENVSLHSTQNPKKKPSLPFEAYMQQTASSLSAVPSNIVTPSSGPPSTKIVSSEKSLEHQEMPALRQHSHDTEPQSANPVIAGMSTDQDAEYSSIQNPKEPGAKMPQSPTSNTLPTSRKEPKLSVQVPVSDLHNSPKQTDPSSTTSIFNAPPASMNQPKSPTQAIRSTPSLSKGGKINSKAQHNMKRKKMQQGLFDLTEEERDFASSNNSHDVIGTLLIGPEGQHVGEIRFRVLEFSSKKLLLNIKVPPRQMHFWFQQICTAEDYRAYYHTHPSGYLGAGYLLPYHQTATAMKQLAETLKLHAAGAIFTSPYFTMFLYPTDCLLENWTFLDDVQAPVIPGAFLRFVLRNPLPVRDTSEVDQEVKRNQIFIPEGEGPATMVLHSLLGIEYTRLVRQPTSEVTAKSNNNFFLLFPETAKPEYHVIFKFLEEHHANIYTWQTDGAWDYFTNQVDAGVILIEGGFYDLYMIPNLSRVLRKPVNVFNITFQADPLAPHPHINRLFPHGYAILITDSFLLLCPQEAARFLRWFRLQVLANKPAGTWKLCTRPAIRDYLLTLIEQRDKENGSVYMQIYENIWYILPEELMEDDEWEVPKSDAPVYCMSSQVSNFDQSVGKSSRTNKPMDEAAIARNDSTQVYWFAGWAMTQLEHFRRFHVVTGGRAGDAYELQRKEWGTKWNHINIMTPDETFRLHKIREWEIPEKKERESKGKETTNPEREVRGSNTDRSDNDLSSRRLSLQGQD